MPKHRIIKVAVPCPLYKLFDYRLATDFTGSIQQGMRVRVPFGRQKLIGVIVEETGQTDVPVNKIKTVLHVLDAHSLLSDDILQLAFWAARYYVHPPGDVLNTVLPVQLRNNDDATPSLSEYWRPADNNQSQQAEILQGLKRAPKQLQIYQLLQQACQDKIQRQKASMPMP